MNYEVEQKHRVEDMANFVAQLSERGVALGPPVEQSDQYFAHPCRDFATTDEALRVRTTGERSLITYKGRRIDTTTKTRRELELPLVAQDTGGSGFTELLLALGFTPVAVVRKTRRAFRLQHAGRDVVGALDEVEGVGSFIELELSACDSDLAEAKQVVATLAAELKLGPLERRSYLEMLLGSSPQREN